MKHIIILTAVVLLVVHGVRANDELARAGNPPAQRGDAKAESYYVKFGLEPYGTLAWQGVDGKARTGAGLNLVVPVAKGFAFVPFGESDNTQHSTIDRAGAGVRYIAPITGRLSLDAGLGGAYDFENQAFFARIPFGANFYAVKTDNVELGARLAYGFDISGSGKRGTADGRGFAGIVANFRF